MGPLSLRTELLKLVYPPRCAACDARLVRFDGMCHLCLESCERIDSACPRCARPRLDARIHTCPCERTPTALDTCTAAFEYGGQLAVSLRRLKFCGRNDIARTLCVLLRDHFETVRPKCDLAVAVPLHRSRLRERGFNQAQRLLIPLAASAGISVSRSGLARIRPTPEQSTLSRNERVANLEGAFRATVAVQGKRILLFDDIRTTGATLEATATALRRAGATEIHGFVVARTE